MPKASRRKASPKRTKVRAKPVRGAKARARKRKPARKARAGKRKKPAARVRRRTAARRPAKRKAAPKKARKPARRPPARATRPAPKPLAAAAPPAPAPVDDLRARVEAALSLRGYVPPDVVAVDVLTAIGRGYRQGPASPPEWLRVDVNGPIADGVADRFATGDRAHDIDRSTHRPTTRATVDIVLDQMAPDVGEAGRVVLTSFALGSWDPEVDSNAERNAIAGFVIPWYLAGR